MAKRASLEFVEPDRPIVEPITKFGGQPCWLVEPQWPMSRQHGKPMRFIGQIRIEEELFPGCAARMAYVFITDDVDEYVDGTWLPDGGENAVILQPGTPFVPTAPIASGPTLQRGEDSPDGRRRLLLDAEYGVAVVPATDPEFIPETDLFALSDDDQEEYSEAVRGNKIGGTPGFLQGDEFPDDSHTWRLLLQLDSCEVPFDVNFGDAGVGYAFIDEGGTVGRFLFQCC